MHQKLRTPGPNTHEISHKTDRAKGTHYGPKVYPRTLYQLIGFRTDVPLYIGGGGGAQDHIFGNQAPGGRAGRRDEIRNMKGPEKGQSKSRRKERGFIGRGADRQ